VQGRHCWFFGQRRQCLGAEIGKARGSKSLSKVSAGGSSASGLVFRVFHQRASSSSKLLHPSGLAPFIAPRFVQ
ncbi:MAG: hypothetical protein ACK5X5_03290, partial [bacterium]